MHAVYADIFITISFLPHPVQLICWSYTAFHFLTPIHIQRYAVTIKKKINTPVFTSPITHSGCMAIISFLKTSLQNIEVNIMFTDDDMMLRRLNWGDANPSSRDKAGCYPHLWFRCLNYRIPIDEIRERYPQHLPASVSVQVCYVSLCEFIVIESSCVTFPLHSAVVFW